MTESVSADRPYVWLKSFHLQSMEIIGNELLSSNKALELFEKSKNWITDQWKEKGRKELRFRILPKTIGRHKGFIIEVTHASEEKKARYYAKIQTVHIHTVMIHYLLNYTKCGPDDFHIVLLTSQDTDDPLKLYKHDVVTREVENCKMASAWTEDEAQKICYSEQLFRTDTFLATLIFAFGRFGNMPRNRDNWGFTNWEEKGRNVASVTRPCLMIVDFSSGGVEAATSSYILVLGSCFLLAVRLGRLA